MEKLTDLILNYLPSVFVVLICLPIHEFAHAFTADRLGDPTPRRAGRLTLNPLAHLDPFGTIALLLVRFGWAKPVPVNPFNLRDKKGGMAIVAIAGPTANLILCLLFAGITRLVMFIPAGTESAAHALYITVNVLYGISYINLALAVFNLLPIPPLDGSKILYFFLPNRISYKIQQYEFYITIAFLALLLLGNFGILPFGLGDLLFLIIRPIWTGICMLFGLV